MHANATFKEEDQPKCFLNGWVFKKKKPKSLTFYVFDRRGREGQWIEIHFHDLTVYCVMLKGSKFSFPALAAGGREGGVALLSSVSQARGTQHPFGCR